MNPSPSRQATAINGVADGSKRAYETYVEYWNDKVRQKERYHG